ncbi:YadA-like family protein [uncultured Legionella sp.]|uniref:YadA family autotransporter adhesin n=1 Tax=uncultured Legionella sp. TaxID=210934 RepID=UPI002611C320|nr:YadA-like family protein [uncultured Legionella sp.]
MINVSGTDGERIITGVAAGISANDAVNLAQLNAAIANISPGVAVSANNASNLSNAVSSGENSLASGYGAQALGTQSTALGNKAVATGVNSVALGYNSDDQGRNNVVSIGSPGSERQITNVAPGTQGTDAVNLNQLNQATRTTRNEARSGIASALAFASLPQAFIPGKFLISGGYGNFQGESGFSMGASKAFADGNAIVKLGGTVSGRGDAGGSVGLGFHF